MNGENQTVSVAADPQTGKLTFEGMRRQTRDQHLRFASGTVVFNNFDPSGVQGLIYMETAHPQPDHHYWALLAQGKGVQVPMELTARELGQGTLNGTHSPEALASENLGTEGEIWADAGNNLMEFDFPTQSLAYQRIGFALKEEDEDPLAIYPRCRRGEERSVSFTSDGLKFPASLRCPKISKPWAHCRPRAWFRPARRR